MSLTVKPFRAFRPQAKRVKEVVLPTFDNLTEKQLNKILKESEYNFLNVVSPEAFYPGISKTNSRKHAYDHLQLMIRNKIIFQEDDECFYVYHLNKYKKNLYGIVASININNQSKKKILKHEAIYNERSKSILKTLKNTKMQVGPVYLSFRDKTNLNLIINKYKKIKPLYKFKTLGGTTRSLWRVSEVKDIDYIKKEYTKVKKFYIADGHHRFSALEDLLKTTKNKQSVNMLSAIFDQSNINILGFHRIANIKNYDHEIFISKIKKLFPLTKKTKFKSPRKDGILMIYAKKQWYAVDLSSNKKIYRNHETDTDILEKVIIKTISNKSNGMKLKNLINVPGKSDHVELSKQVDKGLADIAFFICPLAIKKIMSLADRNKVVPKKSTYFDPKPADGLVNLLMDI